MKMRFDAGVGLVSPRSSEYAGVMPQHQLIGVVLFAVAIVDTMVGLLLVAPRIADENKRTMMRVAFTGSGMCIAG
ncbi:MAG TPA: hypothetical protein VEX18_08220, partial [Polyangiaceae bacterium]|nr:hypothetical protein [Polyangiaceae bacterium]